jgi:hypothetical protein
MRKAWANAAKLASEKSVAWATLWIKFPVLIVMEGRPSVRRRHFDRGLRGVDLEVKTRG